jgi:hypothetical protein
MAILQQPITTSNNGFEIDGIAPSGDYVATCLEIKDEFGVMRRKYQSEDMEEQDVTRFLFGFRGQDNELYKVQSWEMKISGSPKSKLFNFLSQWMGKAPEMGWDYCSLKDSGAIIKVEHKTSPMGKTYAFIAGIGPVKTSLADYSNQVVPASEFGGSTPQPAPQAPTLSSSPAPLNPDENCPF